MRLQVAKTDEICWRWPVLRGVLFLLGCFLLPGCGGTANMPGGCNFSSPYQNTLIYGGLANPASSEEACKDACSMTSSCQGNDWAPGNAAGQQCFLQSKTTDKNTNAPGVTHYDYSCNGTTMPPSTPPMPGGCNFSPPYQNTLIYGGSANPASSEEACKNACRMSSSCQGIDWASGNTAGQQCFLHSKTTDKNTNAPGVTHYDYNCTGSTYLKFSEENVFNYYLRYCSEDCQWIKYYATKISGDSGPRYMEALTIDTCQFACQLTAGCQGIDWNGGCYLQYTQSGKTLTGSKVTDYFFHYDFVCNRGGVCSLTFQNNTVIVNGTAMTLPDCQRACQSMVNCVSIDWARTNNKCNLRSSIRNQATTIEVEHYQPTGDCKGGCTWTTSVKTYVPNVGLIIRASNVSACQSACIQIAGCKSIDWIIDQPNFCFLHATQAGRKHEYSTHYDLQC